MPSLFTTSDGRRHATQPDATDYEARLLALAAWLSARLTLPALCLASQLLRAYGMDPAA
jgi:hypothetical protein